MQYLGKSFTLCVIFLFSDLSFTHGGNVLVLPGEYSHWYNMRNIVDELLNRNHSVTVLVSSASPTINFTEQARFQYLVFEVPLNAREVHSVSEQLVNVWMQYPRPNMVQIGLQIMDLLGRVREMHQIMCGCMLRNETLIGRLKALKFDVLFYDPMIICSDSLAEILDLPVVLSLRFSLGFSMERMCGQMPSPPSYVPVPPTEMTDRMCFMERVKNVIVYVVYSFAFRMASSSLDNLYSEILEIACAGKVLVLPGEYSHWHNMHAIIDALVDRNHSVTVLVSSSSPTVQHTWKERFDFNVFKVNMQKEEASAVWSDFIHLWMNEKSSKYETVFNILRVMSNFMVLTADICKGMFYNEDLLHMLRESNYDVLLSDPMMACSDLMTQTLNIPHVL